MRTVVWMSLMILGSAGMTVACGGRSMGGDPEGQNDGAAGYPDASIVPPDAELPIPRPECEGQLAGGCPDACMDIVGYFWDGAYCQPIICCCEGPDCDQTYATLADCVDARTSCFSEACTDTGGYCSSAFPPGDQCAVGHFPNESFAPGVCGGGTCCSPCLEPDSPQVDYIAHSPEACATIDWDCFSPGWLNFENACGCGCYLAE